MEYSKSFLTIGLLTLLSITFRIIPHLPNFHPLIVICCYLGSSLKKPPFFFTLIFIAVVSDVVDACIIKHNVFGSWMLFNYSAFLLIGLWAHSRISMSNASWRFVLGCLISSVFFWLWTNFGVWLLSGMYKTTATGLLQCYEFALPFLGNSTLAAIIWGMFFVILTKLLRTAGIEKMTDANLNKLQYD